MGVELSDDEVGVVAWADITALVDAEDCCRVVAHFLNEKREVGGVEFDALLRWYGGVGERFEHHLERVLNGGDTTWG